MVSKSMWFETDLSEPRNYIFKAKNDSNIFDFSSCLVGKVKLVPWRNDLSIWPVVCLLSLDFVAVLWIYLFIYLCICFWDGVPV